MILFISQIEDKLLEEYVNQLHKENRIRVVYKHISDLFLKDKISVSCINNKFNSQINDIDFDDVALCFFNYNTIFFKDLFPFEDELDKEYAAQEWNAAFLCLCESTTKTKFINKIVKSYDCNTEIEDILLFQRHQIDTVDMLLTNNVEDLLTMRELCNGEVIIKNLIQGYAKSKLFTYKDCKKLDKLYLSPYIFQRLQNGQNTIITIIGNKFLTHLEGYNENIDIPKGLQERLLNLKKELNLPIVTFYALYYNETFYFYSINQMFMFKDLYNLFGLNFTNLLTEFIIKEQNN